MSDTRKWTCGVLDAMRDGMLDPRTVAEMCLSYMSEYDVADMCRANDVDLFPEEEEDE